MFSQLISHPFVYSIPQTQPAAGQTCNKQSTARSNHSELNAHHASLPCDCSAPWSPSHSSHSLWDCNYHSEYNSDLPQETLYNLTENIINANSSSENAEGSAWTKAEKSLLERGIEIFGKSSVRLAQFVGSKSAGEIKTYLNNFYTKSKVTEVVLEEAVADECTIFDKFGSENVVLDDTEIPATIEEVIASVTTATPTVSFFNHNKAKSNLVKGRLKKLNNMVSTDNLLLKRKITKLFKHRNKKNPALQSKKLTNSTQNKPRTTAKCKMKFATHKSAVSKVDSIPFINGAEGVVKMKEVLEEESVSDLEIDIEGVDDGEQEVAKIQHAYKLESSENTPKCADVTNNNENPFLINTIDKCSQITKDLSDANEQVLKDLSSLEVPKCELTLDNNIVTDLEKYVNKEFFSGRPAKTPQRYLKIRSHILSMWAMTKPNYVTKTSVRTGLKNCGDVNSISRIHQLLEQIGAINFGCTQLNYIRPLMDLILEHLPSTKEKVSYVSLPKPAILSRTRIKKKFTNDGEGGYTLMHNEKGDVISTTVINEDPVVKAKSYNKKQSVRLIYCKPFTEEHPQQYSVHLHLSTLLLMDFHAHISRSEVMGLIGGYWKLESRQLVIERYVPCRNIAPSATHCDMCPLSQAKAADAIHADGLIILGWFHSHPTFAPEPSQQDIDTQVTVQQWLGINQPCIGLILSPFGAHGALIASPYRCLIVDKNNLDDQYVPYKFRIDLISSNLDIDFLLNRAMKIYDKDCNINDKDRVDFKQPYFLDPSISHLDKFLSSVKMHLAKCTNVNKMNCDFIISGFSSICSN